MNLVTGAATGTGEVEPAVQRGGVRVVTVDIERMVVSPADLMRCTAGDQPGADVLTAGCRPEAHLDDPARGFADDEANVVAVDGGEQRPLGAEVLVVADPLDPSFLRPPGESWPFAE